MQKTVTDLSIKILSKFSSTNLGRLTVHRIVQSYPLRSFLRYRPEFSSGIF